jgi:hypothetical protein
MVVPPLSGGLRGVIAWHSPKKTQRGLKVQRSPNFKFNFGPRLALDHA